MPGIIIGIYTHKYQELLLEYAAPLNWNVEHECFNLNILFLFLFFFFHGKVSRNHQHNDTYLNLILFYMMLLINTAGWKITSCRKKKRLKKQECLIIFPFIFTHVAIANCFMYEPLYQYALP